MDKEIGLNDLEQQLKKVLNDNPRDTAEISNLPESTYRCLKERFSDDYDIREIIKTAESIDSEKVKEIYTLHIRRK